MKKIIFTLFVFLIGFSSTSIAQIEFKSDSLIVEVVENPDLVGKNEFTNLVPQIVDFKWKRTILDITAGWDCAICDQNNCYDPRVGEEEVEVGPGASSLLDVHVYANGNYDGSAFVEMIVEHVNDSTNMARAYFVFEKGLSSTDDLARFSLEVYPNPSEGLFSVKDPQRVVSSVRVFDMAGKQLMNLRKGERQWVNLSRLDSGNYWIQLMDKNGAPLGTKMISKI